MIIAMWLGKLFGSIESLVRNLVCLVLIDETAILFESQGYVEIIRNKNPPEAGFLISNV
jgi:hypothetical protein